MACGLYCLLVTRLLQGVPLGEAVDEIPNDVEGWYDQPPFDQEHGHFNLLTGQRIRRLGGDEVPSSGYVIDTLAAGIWSAVVAGSYGEAVLTAVNLGGDTDTIASVAGGIAGVVHGVGAIPGEWRSGLARHLDLEDLFERFTLACLREAPA
jgi:ADP-ribosylglycohydrolase